MKKFIFIILTILFSINLFSQIDKPGLYPEIKNYTRDDYHAEIQNWAMAQDSKGIMYIGNAGGVLMYNSSQWRLVRIKTNSAVKAISIHKNNTVYVGIRSDFGCLVHKKNGEIVFNSFIDFVPADCRNFKDIWKIITYNEYVYFFSADYIFVFKNNSFQKVIKPSEETGFSSAFFCDHTIYVKEFYNGLHKLNEKNELEFIQGSEIFIDDPAKAILKAGNDSLIIITLSKVYQYSAKKFIQLNSPIDLFLKNFVISSSIEYKNNYFLLGLSTNGLLITDKELNPIKLINTQSGLQDNVVNSVYVDTEFNLWLGLSNGISYIDVNLPFSVFNESYGLNKPTQSAVLHNNKLFIGNSLGLYYKNWKRKDNPFEIKKFDFVKNPKGFTQIWKIEVLSNTLFCASNAGLFTVDDQMNIMYIIENTPIRSIIPLKKYPNYYLCGASDGIRLLINKNNSWIVKHFKNYKEYSRNIQQDDDGVLWNSSRTKGIFKINIEEAINNNHDSLKSIELFGEKNLKGLPNHINNYVFKIDNNIIFLTEKGIYQYNKTKNEFEPIPEYNNLLGENKQAIDILKDHAGNIWLKQDLFDTRDNYKSLYLIMLQKKKTKYEYLRTPFLFLKDNINCFQKIDDKNILIGNNKGFTLINTAIQSDSVSKGFSCILSKVSTLINDSTLYNGFFLNEQNEVVDSQIVIPKINFSLNNLRFTASAVWYSSPEKTRYSFFLEGNDDKWTSWSASNYKDYSYLSPGKYKLFVKARNYNKQESKIATFEFIILPPWYRTIWAYISYIIILIVIVWVIIKLNSIRNLEKDKQKLETEVAKRTAEISQKNAELMQKQEEIISQNEQLLEQKNILIQQKEEIMQQNEVLYQNKEEIEAQRDEIENQRDEILAINQNITDSILYARKIQNVILPLDDVMTKALPNHFILYKPRDIVSGDFYWMKHVHNIVLFCAADCTGHGVPGAFMSMLGVSLLNEIISKRDVNPPHLILNELRKRIKKSLHQTGKEGEQKDGMDIAFCVYDNETFILQYAGAHNPLWLISKNDILLLRSFSDNGIEKNNQLLKNLSGNYELFEIKANRMPIGVSLKDTESFTTHEVQLKKDDTFFIFTDGFEDQFGGPNNKKFLSKNLKQLLVNIQDKSMPEQKIALDNANGDWMGIYEQVDDVLIIGVKV